MASSCQFSFLRRGNTFADNLNIVNYNEGQYHPCNCFSFRDNMRRIPAASREFPFSILCSWQTIGQTWEYICGICNRSLFTIPAAKGFSALGLNILLLIIVEWIQRDKSFILDLSSIKKGYLRWTAYLALLFVLFAFGGHATNFIYFQF